MNAKHLPVRGALALFLACSTQMSCGGDERADEPGEEASPPADCEARAEPFVAGDSRLTEDELFTIVLLAAEPAPPAQADNFWSLELEDAAGDAALGASIVAVPYMVDHGHGSSPQIATELGAGRYELGPVALTMAGLWEITLQVTPAGGSETRVVYEFCVNPS